MTNAHAGIKRRGVFFDLYGTLLIYGDMQKAWSEWLTTLHSCLASHGFSDDVGALAAHCDGFFSRPAPPSSSELTLLETRLFMLASDVGLTLSGEDLGEVASCLVDGWESYVSLDPDAHDVLRVLRHRYRLALISNFDHPRHVQDLVRRQGLAEFFDLVVISGDIGIAKPDRRIFDVVLESLDLKAESCIYVGDTEEDAAGAAAAGIPPVTIDRRADGEAAPVLDFESEASTRSKRAEDAWIPSRVIRSLPDLLPLLEAEFASETAFVE